MKTIEERAREYWNCDAEDGYIKGATEQKQIDIDKACEWLEDNAINYVGKDGITDWRSVFSDFRDAMKGE